MNQKRPVLLCEQEPWARSSGRCRLVPETPTRASLHSDNGAPPAQTDRGADQVGVHGGNGAVRPQDPPHVPAGPRHQNRAPAFAASHH
eukprot:3256320-Rhodomonas_salina.6